METCMQALFDTFVPSLEETDRDVMELEGIYSHLHPLLFKDDRKKVRRLQDLNELLLYRENLRSFSAGFHLACRIWKELDPDHLNIQEMFNTPYEGGPHHDCDQ